MIMSTEKADSGLFQEIFFSEAEENQNNIPKGPFTQGGLLVSPFACSYSAKKQI